MNRQFVSWAGVVIAALVFTVGSDEAEARCCRQRTRCCRTSYGQQSGCGQNYGYNTQQTACCNLNTGYNSGTGIVDQSAPTPPVNNAPAPAPAPATNAPAPAPRN